MRWVLLRLKALEPACQAKSAPVSEADLEDTPLDALNKLCRTESCRNLCDEVDVVSDSSECQDCTASRPRLRLDAAVDGPLQTRRQQRLTSKRRPDDVQVDPRVTVSVVQSRPP